MNTANFKFISLIPLNLKEFLALGHFYQVRLPRKFKKLYREQIARQAMQITAHDFIRQLEGI